MRRHGCERVVFGASVPLRGFSPFRIGFAAAIGGTGAYLVLTAVVAVREVLVLIVVACERIVK